ncbi:MAG: hypothetical protein DMD73_15310 [Gemmatimonadetes bacterium]|nr:MAG: hypothetical protein DMD73_15310 [Gemmatimonadota bacterium]
MKEGKEAVHWTRLSCHRFRANEVRRLLGVIAYNLGNLLRRLALPVAIRWLFRQTIARIERLGWHPTGSRGAPAGGGSTSVEVFLRWWSRATRPRRMRGQRRWHRKSEPCHPIANGQHQRSDCSVASRQAGAWRRWGQITNPG